MDAPTRPLPLTLLRTFVLAAEPLSFQQAAARLHVTPAAVSQQIKALEQQLGEPLFRRLTRALALTEAGAALLPPLQDALARIDQAWQQAQRQARLRGAALSPGRSPLTLHLSAPPSLAQHWLLPRLPGFEALHPGWQVQLSASAEQVGPRQARPWPACAAALLYGPAARLGADVQALLRPDYLPVCAPALAAALRTPRDLAGQVLIVDETLAAAGRRGQPWGWPQWLRAAGVRLPATQPRRRYSQAALAIDAALAGQGVALVALPWVAPMLADGRLVAPLPLRLASPYTYGLALDPARADEPAVRALADWLVAQAAVADALPPPPTPTPPPPPPRPAAGAPQLNARVVRLGSSPKRSR